MLPTRLALAILSASRRWWIFMYVLVPASFLAGSLWVSPRIANGIVGICGFLALILWAVSHYNYDRSRTQIDGTARTLGVTFGNAGLLERTVDLDRVESVSVDVLAGFALVRIDAHAFGPMERFVLPEPVLVPLEELSTTLDTLRAAGVAAPEQAVLDQGTSTEALVRLVVTPITLVGVPLVATIVFGQSILVTNGAAVVFLLGLVAIVRELWAGLQRSR